MQISPRKFNIIIFVSILVLIVAYFIFNFVFNKGYVNAIGQTPFEFTINGKLTVCQVSPCEVRLMQGSYTLEAKKEGYGEEKTDFLVRRGDTTEVTVNFEFIPMIRKLDAVSADIFPEKEMSPPSRLGAIQVQSYRYMQKSQTFYILAEEYVQNESKIAQSLLKISPALDDEVRDLGVLANFMKPITDPKLFVSDDENFIAVYDASSGEMFLVNLLQGKREKILTLLGVEDVKFSPKNEKMLVGTVLPGSETLLAYELYNLQGGSVMKDSKIVAEPSSIVFRDDNNILYAVEQEYSPFRTGVVGALEKTGGLKIVTNRNSFLVNYNIGFDKYSNLYEPGIFVKNVTVDENGTVFFGDDENVWEIRFKES